MSLSFARFVPENRGTQRFSEFIFYDVESHVVPEKDGRAFFVPFLWTAIRAHYRKQSDSWTTCEKWGQSAEEFWDWVAEEHKEKKTLYLVSHHLEVDFMPLRGIPELKKRGYSPLKFIANGRTVALWFRKGKKTLVAMNNGNIFDGSIESWGKVLGIPKLDMPKAEDSLEEWIRYCSTDTLILFLMWKTLYTFMKDHDLGNMKLTKASLAYSSFRHRFMTHKIALHSHPQAMQLEREAYHGGRFECTQVGNFTGNFYKLDINSMYAAIQIQESLPCALVDYREGRFGADLIRAYIRNRAVIADVEYSLKDPVFPVVKQGKVSFQGGKQRSVLCTPELEYLLEHGKIKAVYRLAIYEKAPILSEFAAYFTRMKQQYEQEGNLPMRTLAKIFPNAVYGKFAQRAFHREYLGECEPGSLRIIDTVDLDTREKYQIVEYDGKAYKEWTDHENDRAFVAIAAHITAYGRIALWNLVKRAGIKNVYHLATDSLIVNQAGYEKLRDLIDPFQVGKLKVEGTAQTMTLRDVNDYVFGSEEKIKGINKKAVKISEHTYQITAWPRITTLIKNGMMDRYYTRTITKTLARPRYRSSLIRLRST
jgi:hypothetical protein